MARTGSMIQLESNMFHDTMDKINGDPKGYGRNPHNMDYDLDILNRSVQREVFMTPGGAGR